MAITQEELLVTEAAIYRFPTGMIRARRARARMMRRRRTTLGVATLLVAVGVLAGMGRGAEPREERPAAPRTVVVGAGDTLWDMAERFAPASMDLRAYVAAVGELNELDEAIHPGMRLRLP
jgi:hypothetical protein